MKKLVLIATLSIWQIIIFAQTKWNVDFSHSSIKFTVTHLVIAEVDGGFKSYTGSVVSNNPDFNDAVIDFTVDVSSLSTDNDLRDKHLKSPDFFDTEKFPQIIFKSSAFKKISGTNYELDGTLTLHGITKLVKFEVTYGGTIKDSYGNAKAGFKATTTINRFDYGLKWNALTEAGSAVVSQVVTISIKMELGQAK